MHNYIKNCSCCGKKYSFGYTKEDWQKRFCSFECYEKYTKKCETLNKKKNIVINSKKSQVTEDEVNKAIDEQDIKQ